MFAVCLLWLPPGGVLSICLVRVEDLSHWVIQKGEGFTIVATRVVTCGGFMVSVVCVTNL